MTRHSLTNSTLAALTLAATISGCTTGPQFLGGTSRKVTVGNVSDSALNVTFFIKATPEMQELALGTSEVTEGGTFFSDKTFQIDRGDTCKYQVAWNSTGTGTPNIHEPVLHVKIEPVSPSWHSTTTEYWLEVITNPPVSIIATGPADNLTFSTGDGAVAVIPSREIQSGRFEHHMVSAEPSASRGRR